MLTVEKAVLQIMDGTSDLCVLSQKEMDLNDPETRGFLEKHMGRILADPAGHEGQFWNDSGFAATMQRYNIGEIPFTEFAGVVGSACYESVSWTRPRGPIWCWPSSTRTGEASLP